MAMIDGEPDLVVAHSFSANALLELLDQGQRRVPRGVVLVSPFYRAAPEHFDWSTLAYYVNSFHRILEEGIRVQSVSRLSAEVERRMALRARERVGPYGWMRFFDAYLRTPQLRAGRLTGPFLVVAGDRDFASYPEDSQILSRALPDCRLEIFSNCGHFAMAEQPVRFAALMHDFLATAAPGPVGRGDVDTDLELE
jgi:pimeloyl-ACP methyl ester carboxylesterase